MYLGEVELEVKEMCWDLEKEHGGRWGSTRAYRLWTPSLSARDFSGFDGSRVVAT